LDQYHHDRDVCAKIKKGPQTCHSFSIVTSFADGPHKAMYTVDNTCVNKMVISDNDFLARLYNLARFYTAVYVAADLV
jgi:hypothetical protein